MAIGSRILFLMLTITKDMILPATVTGSWPRPRWFDMSMNGRPIDWCMMDTRYREKFTDAMSVVVADEQRAGLDILTHGDLHTEIIAFEAIRGRQ